jgi:hypothetical protein
MDVYWRRVSPTARYRPRSQQAIGNFGFSILLKMIKLRVVETEGATSNATAKLLLHPWSKVFIK